MSSEAVLLQHRSPKGEETEYTDITAITDPVTGYAKECLIEIELYGGNGPIKRLVFETSTDGFFTVETVFQETDLPVFDGWVNAEGIVLLFENK